MKAYLQHFSMLCLLQYVKGFHNISSLPRGLPTAIAAPNSFWGMRSGSQAKIQRHSVTGLTKPLISARFPTPSRPVHATVDPSSIYSSPRNPASRTPGNDTEAGAKKVTWIQRIKKYFAGPDDNLTTKQRLAKIGISAVLSYGCVCNAIESVTISLAWYVFSKNTRMSPLAPGQWKGFLAVYAGFWVFNHLAQPARVAMAVAISPAFDRFVASVQRRLNVSKTVAITSTAIITNVFGTLAAMSCGICLASICAGVPIFMSSA